MAKKNNNSCYAVRKGRRPGIYYDWYACEEQVKGYSGARYRGFKSHQEAVRWLGKVKTNVTGSSKTSYPSPASSPTTTNPPATFDTPVHHNPASSAYNVAGTFYAVARGRQPGIYPDWKDCRKQVEGFSGARYKKFTRLADAQEFCAVYGGGGHFSLFTSEHFQPDQKASFSDEWARLSKAQGWKPGTQRYEEQRASALRNEIQTHFFASQYGQLPVVKAKQGREGGPVIKKEGQNSGGSDINSLAEFDHQRHEAALELLGFQSMCRAVGKTPGNNRSQCEMILRSTLVNIVDLLDACRLGRDTVGLTWTDFAAFKAYTLGSIDKKIPVSEAKKDPILRCFLQNFARPRGGIVSYAPPRVHPARPPVAHSQYQPPTQQYNPLPNPKTEPASPPPFAAPQDYAVVTRKRAISEEDDDFQDREPQEKKVKVEEMIEVQDVIQAKDMTQASDVTQAKDVIEAKDATQADDVIEADDVIFVNEVKVKREKHTDSKSFGREKKKIQRRWAPPNSIMRNWISSV